MYKCKPDIYLSTEPAAGDVVHLPRRLFERLFGDFLGGVLGIVLRTGDEVMYATASPSAEQGLDIYVPLWMATAFEQRTFRDLEALDFTVDRADTCGRASLIVVHPCVEVEIDLKQQLEEFFYDCRYVHANVVLHIGGCEVWIERIVDIEGFEMAVAELGHEVSVDIQDALDNGGKAEAVEAVEAVEAPKIEIPDAISLRAQRLKFFETQLQKEKKNN